MNILNQKISLDVIENDTITFSLLNVAYVKKQLKWFDK